MAGIRKKTYTDKNGKQTTRYYIIYKDINGHQCSGGGYDTKKEALKHINDFEDRILSENNITLGYLFDFFFTKANKYAEKTLKNYKCYYNKCFKQYANVKYKKLDIIFLQNLFNDIETNNGKYAAQLCLKLCKAVVNYAKENAFAESLNINNFENLPGRGISGNIEGKKIYAGNLLLLKEKLGKGEGFLKIQERLNILSEEGKTPLIIFEENQGILGLIGVKDLIRKNSKEAMKVLKELDIETVMLTGDNEKTAQVIAKEAGIDKVIAGVLPTEKEAVIRDLQQALKNVSMVGDGINDSPVLALSDIGISMGGVGSSSAIEASDAVIMTDELSKILEAIKISKKTNKIIMQNLIFAIGTKILVLLLSVLGIANMWQAVFADVGTTLITILNTIRILK